MDCKPTEIEALLGFLNEDVEESLYDPPVGFEQVDIKVEEAGRWSIPTTITHKHISTGRFFQISFADPSTECQGSRSDYNNFDELRFKEVFAKEKTITVYE